MQETLDTLLERARVLEQTLADTPIDVETRLRDEVLPTYISAGAVEDQARVLEWLADLAVDGNHHAHALYLYVEKLKPLYTEQLHDDQALLQLTGRVAFLIAQQVSVADGAAVLWESISLFGKCNAMDQWEASLQDIAQFQIDLGQSEEALALLGEGRRVVEALEGMAM